MTLSTLAPAVFLMGPTASGKTDLAVALAERFPMEIISVDSALVYRDMNIGTAKPDSTVLSRAPHHLIDIIDPVESYSAAQFVTDALRLMEDIASRDKIPLLAGGTMMYFNALQQGLSQLPQAHPEIRARLEAEARSIGWPELHQRLAVVDPDAARRINPNDAQRIQRALEVYEMTGKSMTAMCSESRQQDLPYDVLKVALIPSQRSVLHERIARRFDRMLASGLYDELLELRSKYPGLSAGMPSMRCVGYRQMWQHLDNQLDYQSMREKGIAATRQLAKRQLTWLRGMDDTYEIDCLSDSVINSVSAEIKIKLHG